MSDGNLMNLKIFLKGDAPDEVRRITVDASVATSFLFVKEKLQSVFPNLRNSQFKITWRDVDDDEITIASDEDLITAFTEMNGNVKVLTVTVSKRAAEAGIYVCAAPEDPKRVIICDGCNRTITGFRYKCLQCPDFDLCGNCEFEGCHSNHVMVRLPHNETYSPRCARKFMHHIARNFKKSAHCASKEAHRAAKHAARYASRCRQNDSSTEEDNQPGCPFSTKDAHELGTFAHQKLSEIFKPTTSSGCQGKDDKDQLMDVIRNVVDGFFGVTPNPTPTTSNRQQQTDASPKTATENPPAPMETENSPSAPIYPVLDRDIPNSATPGSGSPSMATAGSATPPENNRNPEWTFVASNGQTDKNNTDAASAPQTNQPRVAFIYHENPVIAEGLVKLHEMGFSNETGVLSNLLEHFNGNVNDVVKAIFDRNI